MTIGVLALVGVTPERVAALTAAGYAVHEGKTYANRTDAVREAADTARAVLTNGRGGLSGDDMAWLPNLEIVCAVGAGYEAIDLDTARRRVSFPKTETCYNMRSFLFVRRSFLDRLEVSENATRGLCVACPGQFAVAVTLVAPPASPGVTASGGSL